jgi:hypothetical protein
LGFDFDGMGTSYDADRDGCVLSFGFSDLLTLIKGTVIAATISFGIAFAVNGRNWNGVSRRFYWIPLVIGATFA